jgi:hypothetical protein
METDSSMPILRQGNGYVAVRVSAGCGSVTDLVSGDVGLELPGLLVE